MGQIRPNVSNGPVADSSLPMKSNSTSSPHHPHIPLCRTPSAHSRYAAQPIANGPVLASPTPCSTAGTLGNTDAVSVGNNHLPGLRSNGNVPYLRQNALPHNCTTPTSSSMDDEPWKSQHINSTQVRLNILADMIILIIFVLWPILKFYTVLFRNSFKMMHLKLQSTILNATSESGHHNINVQ